MNLDHLQLHINFIKQNAATSCLKGQVDYIELPRADLKRALVPAEEHDDQDQDPWRVCLFEMEPHKGPEQRSKGSDAVGAKNKFATNITGAGVAANSPEDVSGYGKYYGVDTIDSDSETDSEDEEFALPFGSKVLSKFEGHQVALLPDRTIIKSGKGITFNEILALQIADCIGLPVPRLYEQDWQQYYYYHDSGDVSIRMEYIRGKTLLERWPQMEPEEKVHVMRQLCSLLVVMRCVCPPIRVIGSCDGSQVRDSRAESTHFGPPCHSEAEFNDYLISTIAYAPDEMRAAYSRSLARDHCIVFSHGDLSPDNIILDRKLNVIGIVDWEDSGWYPEYWEYVKFFARPPAFPDWHEYAEYLFPQRYKKELLDFRTMARFRAP